MNRPDGLPHGARVVVIRLRSLGDSVLSTPAVHLLKRHRPDLEIAVVSEAPFAPIWEGNPDVSAILPPTAKALRRFRPDLCLNLHGGTNSARLTALSGARIRAGFAHFRFPFVYNCRIPRAQEILGVDRPVHTVEHAASAMFHLGVPIGEIPRARVYSSESVSGAQYAVIHPMASQPDKTWPAASFRAVAEHLAREMALDPVFIAAQGEDLSAFEPWSTLSGASLPAIKKLMSGASLFVGNDSGPAHLAAAFGVPVVVIFGSSDPIVWAPWRTASETIVANGPIASIAPSEVITALDRLRVLV